MTAPTRIGSAAVLLGLSVQAAAQTGPISSDFGSAEGLRFFFPFQP